jgi:hypothetical protein
MPSWTRKLSRPVKVKHGPVLHTLADARAFMVELPEAIQMRKSWQHAAAQILAARPK